MHIATVVADKTRLVLDESLLEKLAGVLPDVAGFDWLEPGVAADIAFALDSRSPAALETLLRLVRGDLPLDIAVQPAEGRRKKLLVADMDSTMIGQECIDELGAELGLKAEIAAITERAMRGEIAYEPSLRERVALLADLEEAVIEKILAERIFANAGAEVLVRTMRAHGAHTAIVSSGFTSFTGPVAARLGFHEHRGNRLLVEKGRLVGRVAEPILARDAKVEALRELRERLGLAREETMAVGDGANDLGMLLEAGVGVAYRAKPAVAEAADVRIDFADLTALLFIQGFRLRDFAGA
jgi:phosphoserine phosphatase